MILLDEYFWMVITWSRILVDGNFMDANFSGWEFPKKGS